MLVLFDRSRADWSLHLTSSVGHKTSEAKNAAEDPDKAFSKELSSLMLFFEVIVQIAFWHKPYDMNKTAFSFKDIKLCFKNEKLHEN